VVPGAALRCAALRYIALRYIALYVPKHGTASNYQSHNFIKTFTKKNQKADGHKDVDSKYISSEGKRNENE
jgi:hypothetical protein